MHRHLVALGVAAVILAGCSAPSTQPAVTTAAPAATSSSAIPTPTPTLTPTKAADATAVATELKAKVPSITGITTVTEELDSNKLLGRPNQYTSAAWIADAGATPGETGIDSGAVVEVFANEADATARSEYILRILKKAGPAFGTEWHHQKGNVLLRVSGVLSPSVNDQYKAAVGS
ncbi:hypothetical protein ACS5PJ_10595 [Pseudarthrobacter sp. YS3]|uniref:hypothetical protein n=1 Tax=Pseudarthrobacter sp. YS3 TaxID=3453718 RepID=UPI003EEC3CB6